MIWKEITLPTNSANIEHIEDALLKLGACSVTIKDAEDQPILEPAVGEIPLWDKMLITALFTQEHNLNNIEKKIHSLFESVDHKTITTREFKDQDWERSWMDDFHPMKFGKRLWICPSWQNPPDKNAVNVILDPGLAFGTGTHQTTSLCLEWLDKYINDTELVIDYGCGSGILAIAALKLGAKQAVGIDNDPQAIIASKNNSDKNKISRDQFKVHLPHEQQNDLTADVLVANILAKPLMTLAPSICNSIKTNGKFALSGILREQADEVANVYSAYCDIDKIIHRDDWVLISGTKKSKS